MIIIRPNPAFFESFHPCGVDAASASKESARRPSCHRGGEKQNSCQKRPTSPSSVPSTPITNDQDSVASTDSNTIVEKTPLHRNETPEKTTISLDVAGFAPEHLTVDMEGHVLTISAKRTNKLGDTFVTYRRLALKADTYDEDTVKAELDDGVLEIIIQKKIVPKSRHIPITLAKGLPTTTTPTKPSASSAANNTLPSSTTDEHVETDSASTNKAKKSPPALAKGFLLGDTKAKKSSPTLAKGTKKEKEEVATVETVNENDDEEAEEVEGHRSNITTGVVENADKSSAKNHDDTWENVVHA